MKKTLLLPVAVLLGGCGAFHSQVTPVSGGFVEKHGRLKLVGNQLSGAMGEPVQLRGVSFFWINWLEENLKPSAVRYMRNQMGASVVRIPVPAFLYDEGAATYDAQMRTYASWARSQGMYAIIDWHVVDNPQRYKAAALRFWKKTASYFSGDPGVLFEICNEPTSSGWKEDIKPYAEEVLAVIRDQDSTVPVIVGTPEWSRRVRFAAEDPLTQDAKGRPARHVLYTYHGYAASHGMRYDVEPWIDKIPIFATEWGASEASGDGQVDFAKSREFVDFLHDNPVQKVSWCQWSWADKRESSALLRPGTGGLSWQLSEVGDSCSAWIRGPGGAGFPAK